MLGVGWPGGWLVGMDQMVAEVQLGDAGAPGDADTVLDAVAVASMMASARWGTVAAVAESLDLLQLADRLASWTAAQRARLVS